MSDNGIKPAASNAIGESEIQAWLVRRMSDLLNQPPGHFDPTKSLVSYGLESVDAVGITGDLMDWLDIDLDPILLYDYPTLTTLSHYLAGQVALATD